MGDQYLNDYLVTFIEREMFFKLKLIFQARKVMYLLSGRCF
jgi:hypothetical protein